MTERKTTTYAGLDEALILSRDVHGRHLSRDGRPYFEHVAAVLERVDALIARISIEILSPSDAEATRILAVLHDIVEEGAHTGIDAAELLARGYEPRVVAWVERLSGRPDGVTYNENIVALASEADLPPILVKLADNDHNMDPDRIAALPPEGRSIENRYRRSAKVLVEEIGRRTGWMPELPILESAIREGVPAPRA